MKYIVMTHETQGAKKNDFQNCAEGELVRLASTGDYMVGIDCNKAGTTMKVVELDKTSDELIEIYAKHFLDTWGIMGADVCKESATDEVTENMRIANAFELGTVIEMTKKGYQSRTPNATE